MLIESKSTKSFTSHKLTKSKFNEIKAFAMIIKEHKNLVSKHVNDNLLDYLDISFFTFLKLMRGRYNGVIPSNFDKQLYGLVFTSYKNKISSLTKNIKFERIEFKGFDYYKRNTKNKKVGDVKNVIIKKSNTNLSNCLTYLSRYGHENIQEYINNQLNDDTLTKNKRKFYENIINCINKFGFDRLLSLSLSRRYRILNRYKNPIEFKSLTFGGRCRLSEIISYNKNYNSKINSFISLSWLKRGDKIDIPVLFSKDYHGNMRDYRKDNPDYEYEIVFTNKGKINVNICKDYIREFPDSKTNYVGIDVNAKNNLFALSDGSSYNYDKKLLDSLIKELLKVDELKKDSGYTIGRSRQRKINSMRNKLKHSTERLCVEVCKILNKDNLDHVIFEHLDNSFGRSYAKDKDINYNRIIKELHLSSLKDEFEHIARKYDIMVSTIHPEYTSKACSSCGCIDDDNRQTQEEFKCVECGYENNADINAAINIKNRVSVTVLRDTLLTQNKIGNGSFKPKTMKRKKVKEILLSFRYSPEMDRNLQQKT